MQFVIWLFGKLKFLRFSTLVYRCFLIDSSASRCCNLLTTINISTLQVFIRIGYDEDNIFPLRIFWMDEAHFSSTERVNSINCVFRTEENPENVALRSLFEAKLRGFAFILGTYFFEEVASIGMKTCFITSRVNLCT